MKLLRRSNDTIGRVKRLAKDGSLRKHGIVSMQIGPYTLPQYGFLFDIEVPWHGMAQIESVSFDYLDRITYTTKEIVVANSAQRISFDSVGLWYKGELLSFGRINPPQDYALTFGVGYRFQCTLSENCIGATPWDTEYLSRLSHFPERFVL